MLGSIRTVRVTLTFVVLAAGLGLGLRSAGGGVYEHAPPEDAGVGAGADAGCRRCSGGKAFGWGTGARWPS